MKKIHKDFVLIKSKQKIVKVYLKEVLYLRKANDYTEMILAGGREITICKSLLKTVSLINDVCICKLCCNYAPNLANVSKYDRTTRRLYFNEDTYIIVPEKKVALLYKHLVQNFIVL